MKSKLKARLAQLGPVRAAPRIQSGFAAVVMLKPKGDLADVKTVDAAMALTRYGVKMLQAKRAVEAMLENGEACVPVPNVTPTLARALGKAGVAAAKFANDPVDVRALREAMGLSQTDFANRFRFKLRSVQNWEQGRTPDESANNYLRVIATDPDLAMRAQLEKLS